MTAFLLNDINNFRDDVMSQPTPFPLLLGRELERRQFRDLWKLKNNNNNSNNNNKNNNNNKITKIVAKLTFSIFFIRGTIRFTLLIEKFLGKWRFQNYQIEKPKAKELQNN